MSLRPALLAVGLLFGAAACEQPAPSPSGPEPALLPAEPVADPAIGAVTGPVSPVAGSDGPAPAAQVALDGEGLRLVAPATGSTTLLAFGAASDQVLASLTRLRGAPPERSSNPDCGPGRLQFAKWPDGLSVVLQGDRFAGWSVNAPAPRPSLTTMSGVGLGSTRRDLESAYAARIEESTLGQEFTAGGLSGLLDSPAPGARITDLWAGVTCIFR